MRTRTIALALTLGLSCVLAAEPATAQTTLGVSGYFTGGSVLLSASDSFDAVAQSSRTLTLGAGATVTDVWRRLFVDVAVSRQTLDGQRVFVSGGTVFPLGIPWRATFTPVDVAAGWRAPAGRVVPYAGVGVSIVSYTERSDFAQQGDDVSERKTGAVILGGADVPVTPWLRVGGEVRYRIVKSVLGAGGVSEVFGEDDLGGLATAVRVTVGR
jgi:hypothetical protein